MAVILRNHLQMRSSTPSRFVLVHGGARDGYQVVQALQEAGLLESLITDLAWSSHRPWMRSAEGILPAALLNELRRRNLDGVPHAKIINFYSAAFRSILLDRVRRLPFALRQRAIRSADRTLGNAAGKRARNHGNGLLSYSYYAYDAFRAYGKPGVLFQVHPHPLSVRRILTEELQAHPECAATLWQEWELSLPDDDFQRLVQEPAMASHFLCASGFTRETLIEHGADPASIRVVPYGVDLQRFQPAAQPPSTGGPLRLLFVGRINQRKGLLYLLQALDMLKTQEVELTICGRIVDSLDLFRPYLDRITIRPSVSVAELSAAYQQADLFVFPSVVEGFAQVLLEALASGLPILSTTHTAAPDLITDGVEGFIVQPRRPDLLAERIDWAASNREALARMRIAARQTATRYTWQHFRSGVADAMRSFGADTKDVAHQ